MRQPFEVIMQPTKYAVLQVWLIARCVSCKLKQKSAQKPTKIGVNVSQSRSNRCADFQLGGSKVTVRVRVAQ